MPLNDTFDLVEIFEHLIRGWRYLLSRSYRQRKNREWRESWLNAVFEIPFALFFLLASVALIGFAAWMLWSSLRL